VHAQEGEEIADRFLVVFGSGSELRGRLFLVCGFRCFKERLEIVSGKISQPVIAQVNYHFFPSTQTFIYFYLSRFRAIHPICLTNAPESKSFTSGIPAPFVEDYHLHNTHRPNPPFDALVRMRDRTVRSILTRLPPGAAAQLLAFTHRRIVPLLRSEADAADYLDWAEAILRRRKVCLIHAHFGPIGWRLLALKRKLSLPLVVTFLGDEIASELKPWDSWWIQSGSQKPDWPARLRELTAEADLLLAEGTFLRQRLINLGCPPEKVQVQPIAIPVAAMPFRPRKPRHGQKAIIVFAGRFVEQKGLLYALEAVRALWSERRDFEFRVIGDEKLTGGDYAVRVYSYVRKSRLQECVRLLGFLNHQDYVREMQQGDLFVHPSVVAADGASEGGAPTTILEAQALGMPVLSTYHCDIPNVTVPGQSALLVPERDSKALAQALRSLLDHPENWEGMGRAGREHIERFHNIDKEVPALESRYLRLLAASAQKPRADERA